MNQSRGFFTVKCYENASDAFCCIFHCSFSIFHYAFLPAPQSQDSYNEWMEWRTVHHRPVFFGCAQLVSCSFLASQWLAAVMTCVATNERWKKLPATNSVRGKAKKNVEQVYGAQLGNFWRHFLPLPYEQVQLEERVYVRASEESKIEN